MTLVNIDLKNAGYETGPDDRVVFYSLLVREGEFGTISTAPVEVPLVDGKGSKDLAPGPVGVQIIAGQVADTRVKIGEVPPSGPTTLNAVMMVTPAYTPALQAVMIAAIERARDEALSRVGGAVAAEVDAIKWDRGHVPLDATSISDLAVGSWRVSNDARAVIVASPGLRLGNVSIGGVGTSRTAFFVSQGTASEPPMAWVQAERGGVWSGWDRLAFTDAMEAADTALGQRITNEKWARPLLRSGDTVNDKTGSSSVGLHPVTAAVAGLPKATPGWVQVLYDPNSNRAQQRFIPSSPSEYSDFTRIYSGGVWSDWVDVSARAALLDAKAYSDAGDAALGQRIDAEKWRQRGLSSADNLDDLRGSAAQGLYHVTAAVGGGTGKPGWVEVTYDSGSARTRQVFTSSSPSDAVSLERKYSGGTWREWTPVTWHGVVVTSGSADDLLAPHAYAINATGVLNLPVAILGSLQTLPSGADATTLAQIFVSSETVPRMWTRTRRNSVWGQWVRWTTHQDVEGIATRLIDENRYVAPTMTMEARETPIASGARIVASMTEDGRVGYNNLAPQLNQSFDNGATWEPVRTFGGQYVEWCEPLPTGELMVCTNGTVGGKSGRHIWVSAGYDRDNPTAATWEITKQNPFGEVKYANWSFYAHENRVLLADYGPKSGMPWGSLNPVPEGENARYVYQSMDGGYTWETIFDLNIFLLSNGRTTADRQHLHGVAWDKWWNRIWVTFGDASGDGTNGVVYSDDEGATWQVAYWTHTHTSQGWQVVGIQPMKDCVLFAGDMTPSGLIALDRSEGRNAFNFYTAWDFSETEKHLCHVIRYSSGPLGEIALFAFAREGSASPSFIVGTRDGFTFEVLWQETGASLPGIRSLAGPSADGTVIAAVSSGSGWSEVQGTLTVHGTPWAVNQRIAELFPSSIRAGQVLKWDGTKFIPSWLDQHTDLYDNVF